MSAPTRPVERVQRPLVSVVVNNYNYGRYLAAAIESALAQGYRPLEVIVVDDGSTDDSRAIIAGFGERVRPVLKENGGQASALNAGFAASSGEVVLFLDADDVLLPDAIEAAVAAWQPDVARTQFPLEVMDGSGRRTGGKVPSDELRSGDMRPLLLRTGAYPGVGTTGTAFSRQALEQVMPIPEAEWRRQPDLYLLLTTVFFGRVESLARPLGLYRVHGANNWARRGVDVARLREQLAYDLAKEALLREWAGRFGFELPARWLLQGAEHLQARIASLRLDPAQHPFRQDRRAMLAARGVAASLRNPAFARRKRWLFALWFAAVGIAPGRLSARLIELSFAGSFRPYLLRRLIHGRASRATSRPGGAGQLERV